MAVLKHNTCSRIELCYAFYIERIVYASPTHCGTTLISGTISGAIVLQRAVKRGGGKQM